MTNPWGSNTDQSFEQQVPLSQPQQVMPGFAQPPSYGTSPLGAPGGPPAATYGVVDVGAAQSIAHIRWLASAGWPPEAIAADLALRGFPTLGGKLPFIGDTWRPYMVRRIISGEAPSASYALYAGLIAWLINPVLLVSVAAIALWIQTRKEIRDSEGSLSGGGKATAGFILGLLAGLIVAVVLVASIVLSATMDPAGY